MVGRTRGGLFGVNLKATPKKEGGSRWWQLKYFFMFTPIPGEMILFDAHIFQMAWFTTN